MEDKNIMDTETKKLAKEVTEMMLQGLINAKVKEKFSLIFILVVSTVFPKSKEWIMQSWRKND